MKNIFTLLLLGASLLLNAQTEGADTTSVGYQIGYQIGSWLPFILVAVLAVLVINKTRNSRQ
jgi:cytochrome c biogenesis protein CcdA